MSTKNMITKDAVVKEAHMGATFTIELEDGQQAIATISGKMRKFRIRILPGDRVRVEFSPHDETRGRITFRYR